MQHQQPLTVDARWDAGDRGCSRLIVGIRRELESLPVGARLEITATDPAAALDLWVWCRMTGHGLVFESHPVYVIERQARSTTR